jgi:hypothetical protein
MSWPILAKQMLSVGIGTFGQSVIYTPLAGSPVTIQGVFDVPHSEIQLGHISPVSSVSPKLGIRLDDLSLKPKKGDTVTVGSVVYRVIDSEEDGQGGSTLKLQKQ